MNCKIFIALLLASPAIAAETDAIRGGVGQSLLDDRSEKGFTRIFNGKDLTGWTKIGAENWTVEDGVIHGQGVTKQYGYLMTEKDYKDFWLSLRYKCEADGKRALA